MEIGKATALTGGAVGGGLISAAITSGDGGPYWPVLAPVLGVAGLYGTAVLLIGILVARAGAKAMRATTKPEHDRAMAVYTTSADLLCRLLLGLRPARGPSFGGEGPAQD